MPATLVPAGAEVAQAATTSPTTTPPAAAPPPPAPKAVAAESSASGAATVAEQAMLDAVNAERSALGLAALRFDDALATVARGHAGDMVRRGYLGHVSPDGKTLRQRLKDAGIKRAWVGENYVVTRGSEVEAAQKAVAWFMADPPHRDNILHRRFNSLGVGVAERGPGWYVFVLDFAGD